MTPDLLQVLYEDNHIIAINKPAGMLMQGDKTGDAPLGETVKAYIKEKYAKPGLVFLGLVHRIDRPVTGVVLYARTSKALARLNELFKERDIQKTYWALVEQRPALEAGTLIHWLKKNEEKNKSFAHTNGDKGGLKCELQYRLIGSSDHYHLLEVKPLTGRHHQIRVQLATMGCIIKGDLKYGAKRSNKDGSICLHARHIEFVHPVRDEPIAITAPVPNDPLWRAMEQMIVGTEQ
jgi:23S rRNA pseudouridine1911/1915/1917 synthase